MRLLVLFSLIVIGINLNGQEFAIINDPDGYTNVRQGPSTKSPIEGIIKNNEVFAKREETVGNWVFVEAFQDSSRLVKFQQGFPKLLTETNSWIPGYVHKSRIALLEDFPKLSKQVMEENGQTKVAFANDTINFTLKIGPFDPSKNKIQNGRPANDQKINGKTVYGTDGNLPRKEIKSISTLNFWFEGQVSKDAFQNLYEPNPSEMRMHIGPNNNFFLEMYNSDGAGGYYAVLHFEGDQFIQRFVNYWK